MSTSVPRSEDDLIRQLGEQLGFMRTSARLYDEGRYHEAKRLAVAGRVLCHDTTSSSSLLSQLGVLNELRFVDTNSMSDENRQEFELPRDPDLEYVTVFQSGLAPMGGFPTGLVAPRDRATRYAPKPFTTWWNAPVLRDTPDSVLTRREIVLMLANKDGGAHVDPVLDERYDALSRRNGLGEFSYRTSDGVETVVDTNPALPIMRQIAFELLATLQPVFGLSD